MHGVGAGLACPCLTPLPGRNTATRPEIGVLTHSTNGFTDLPGEGRQASWQMQKARSRRHSFYFERAGDGVECAGRWHGRLTPRRPLPAAGQRRSGLQGELPWVACAAGADERSPGAQSPVQGSGAWRQVAAPPELAPGQGPWLTWGAGSVPQPPAHHLHGHAAGDDHGWHTALPRQHLPRA